MLRGIKKGSMSACDRRNLNDFHVCDGFWKKKTKKYIIMNWPDKFDE